MTMSSQIFRFFRHGVGSSLPLSRTLNGYFGNPSLCSSLRHPENKLVCLTSLFSKNLHTSNYLEARSLVPNEPKKWPLYNDIVYPPRPADQPMRVAEVFHHRSNMKYSYKKMWYIASMIRGMSIDEAKKQLQFMRRAGAKMVIEILEEAQELAVKEHNVEYRSNLWIAESFVGKATVIKSVRKHKGYRFGKISYGYIHYFVCLREGKPPEQYYTSFIKTGNEHVKSYIEKMRNRRIQYTL